MHYLVHLSGDFVILTHAVLTSYFHMIRYCLQIIKKLSIAGDTGVVRTVHRILHHLFRHFRVGSAPLVFLVLEYFLSGRKHQAGPFIQRMTYALPLIKKHYGSGHSNMGNIWRLQGSHWDPASKQWVLFAGRIIST